MIEITPPSEPIVISRVSGLMMIVIDPDHKKIINTTGMEKMFGLSKAERNICHLLVDGYSTSEIADTRNVSPVTIKNQIQAFLTHGPMLCE